MDVRDHFVDHLTHKAYFIQTRKIKPSYNTRLEKLLSIFEQAHFIGDGNSTKGYHTTVDDPAMKEIVKILEFVAGDEQTRDELTREDYYIQYVEDTFGDVQRELTETKENLEKVSKDYETVSKDYEAVSKDYETVSKDYETVSKDKEILTKDKEILTKDKEILTTTIAEKDQKLIEIAKELLQDGKPVDKISLLTGLSVEEINQIKSDIIQ